VYTTHRLEFIGNLAEDARLARRGVQRARVARGHAEQVQRRLRGKREKKLVRFCLRESLREERVACYAMCTSVLAFITASGFVLSLTEWSGDGVRDTSTSVAKERPCEREIIYIYGERE
jgi:hypothetical protein